MRLLTTILTTLCALVGTAYAQYRDGEVDRSFGVDGVYGVSFLDNDFGYDVVATPEGRIVVLGSSENIGNANGRDARAVIFDAGGSQLDSKTYPHGNFGCSSVPEAFYAGALEPGGTILAGGFVQVSCGNGAARDFYVVRMDGNGTELSRFDRPVFHGVQDNVWALDVQQDGRVVAAGFADTNAADPATRDIAVARYNTDGTLDQSFGSNGEVLIDVAGDYDFAYGVAVDQSGRILISGFARSDDQFDYVVVRLDSTGARDDNFGNEGVVLTDIGGFDNYGTDLVVQRNGKPIVVGNQNDSKDATQFTVVKYNEDGTPDQTFGTAGIATVDLGSDRAGARKVALQSDCKIVVSGFTQVADGNESSDMIAVARLNADGSLDTSFNNGSGTEIIDVAQGKDDYASGMTTLPNGNIVISGNSADRSNEDVTWDVALTSVINDNVLFSSTFGYCP